MDFRFRRMKKRILLSFCLFLACAVSAFSQNAKTGPDGSVAITEVAVKPLFNGKSSSEFAKWVASNIKYPAIALENGIQGRVMVQFVVNPDGTVSNVSVVRGVDPNLDKEAIRVVSKSPKWTPGYMADNTPAKVFFTYPVAFYIK